MYNIFSKKLGKENIFLNEPMKNHTTFRIGGNADCFVKCSKEEHVLIVKEICEKNNIPLLIIGNGSNILVSDDGIEGIVMQLSSEFSEVKFDKEKNLVYAKSGVLLSKLASSCLNESLGGLECVSGIPGTLGGALYMNAGAYEDEISNHVVSVTVLDEDLEIKTLDKDECEFSYRKSKFTNKNIIILSAVLKLTDDDPDKIKEKMDYYTKQRVSKQPLDKPSAGSTFKRPEGNFAGSLIEKSGLKGKRIGGAVISEKHAGFIINDKNATAKDVIELIEYVKKTVDERFGVKLEPEVKFIGRF